MIVVIGNTTFAVRWHFHPRPHLKPTAKKVLGCILRGQPIPTWLVKNLEDATGLMTQKHRNGYTICIIKNHGGTDRVKWEDMNEIASHTEYCSWDDRFIKMKGRKKSLKQALAKLFAGDRQMRVHFWNQYSHDFPNDCVNQESMTVSQST